MEEIRQRIKKADLRKLVCSPEDAANYIQTGLTVATTGKTLLGYPKAVFMALAHKLEQGENIRIDLLSTGPLGPEIEEALVKLGGIRRRIGTVGTKSLRDAINRREVAFVEGKSGRLTQYARHGYYGPIHLAIVEAAGINEEGHIIPTTSVYDAPDWVEMAENVIIEINTLRPLEMEGFHDIYDASGRHCIPLNHPLERIGKPYIPLDPKKIRGIVLAKIEDRDSQPDHFNEHYWQIAKNMRDFLRQLGGIEGVEAELPPLEVGIGSIMSCFLASLADAEFNNLCFYLAAATDPILDLIDADKIRGVSCTTLRFSRHALNRFLSNLDKYRHYIVIRPVTVTNSAELIQRLGVIAINSCLEADITGQVNSSHVMGSRLVGGIAGSYDYSRSSAVSIFALAATARGGKISSIVSRVSHVDHTEHDVDAIITEHGYADLRATEPYERAFKIIHQCADPDFRGSLISYVKESMKNPGRVPIILERTNRFAQKEDTKDA